MTWVSPHTWLGGERWSALRGNEIRDSLKAIGDPWGSYTPVLASTGTAPTVSAATGGFIQAGKDVRFHFDITINAVGTGSYTISLPVQAASYISISSFVFVSCYDVSAGLVYPRIGFSTGSTTVFAMNDMAAVRVSGPAPGSNSPFIWATGDRFVGHGFYEAA